ncbi:MAG TPA: DUF898 family protein, partial [Nitrospiria bacterium]|nr:DUF898 family protein [Nitrospiria bacterium]
FGPYALALLLTVPTLGLVWFWFWARRTRYYWEHTSFATARFQSTMTAWRLFSLHAGNLLLLIVTLGVAWPWATIRKIRVEFANLSLVGPLDASLVKQDAQAATATGDSLGQFLDADMGLAA